jgi:glycosyltransferase involved in cell wall biosynthesis
VRPSETGLLFPPGDAQALAAAVRRLLADPAHLARMRLTARAEFERRFTAERNYEMLLAIYARALSGARGATPRRASP